MWSRAEINAITFGNGRIPLEHLDFFEMSSEANTYEAMLCVFRSDLGSALQAREPSELETRFIRETVAQMINLASKTDAGRPAEYLVELVDSDEADFRIVSPELRSVFSLSDGGWRTDPPLRISVS